MADRTRQTIPMEFEAKTVRLIQEGGKIVNEVCRDLDLVESAMRNWLRQAEGRFVAQRARRVGADITSVLTREGWRYAAVELDPFVPELGRHVLQSACAALRVASSRA